MNTVMNTMHLSAIFIWVYDFDTRTENPCVGGSIPPLGTIHKAFLKS